MEGVGGGGVISQTRRKVILGVPGPILGGY